MCFYVLLVHLFVYFARVNFCRFSGVRGWLRLLIVALPGHFYLLFFEYLVCCMLCVDPEM